MSYYLRKYALQILIIICIAFRIVFAYAVVPVKSGDGPGYIMMAEQIRDGKFIQDNGARTPIYSLFLIICNIKIEQVRIFEMLMGITITILLFIMVWRTTNNILISFIAGACYGINLGQIQFENMVMTETLTTLFIVITAFMLLRFSEMQNMKDNGKWWFLGAGIMSAIVGLTRPLFIFLNPIIALLVLIIWPHLKKKWIILFIIPFLILVGGWSLYNYNRFEYFGPTTLTGYNLTNHSGALMEKANDKYAVIRDIYIEARGKHIAQTGNSAGTIWRCYPKIMAETKLTFAGLSKQLTRISLELIYKNPILYLESVGKGFLLFWYVSGKKQWEEVMDVKIEKYMNNILIIEGYIFLLINLIFLIFMVIGSYFIVFHKKHNWIVRNLIIVTAIFIVLLSSVIQSFMEYGANNRYMLPVQPLVVFVVFTIFSKILKRKFYN